MFSMFNENLSVLFLNNVKEMVILLQIIIIKRIFATNKKFTPTFQSSYILSTVTSSLKCFFFFFLGVPYDWPSAHSGPIDPHLGIFHRDPMFKLILAIFLMYFTLVKFTLYPITDLVRLQ